MVFSSCSIIQPCLDQLKDDPVIQMTKDQGTWISSLLAIGAIIGAVPSGIFSDMLGRKKAAILITVPYIISFLLVGFAKHMSYPIWWLYAARLLIGTCFHLQKKSRQNKHFFLSISRKYIV